MQRPTSVTVFGILNIVFAGLGIFGLLGTILMVAMVSNSSNNPVIQLFHENPAYAAWTKLLIVMGLAARAVLLAAGIGLLKLKPWARIVSIAYAIYSFVMILASTVVNYLFLLQPTLQQAHGKPAPEAAGAIGGALGGTFGGCFGLIYPVLLLIFMLRANVIAAFRPPTPAASQPPPVPQP